MTYPFQTRKCLNFTGVIVFLLLLIQIIEVYKHSVFINSKYLCYYDERGDALPAAESLIIPPNTRSIFFHETSCRGWLTVRQACAVEAAARAHPQWKVYVLFSASVTYHALKTTCLATLLQFPNIKYLRVHLAEYAKGTDVHSVLLHDLEKSKFPVQHLADILRIVTLNKWGGVYLDTDMIVTRSLDQLPLNFVAKESYEEIATGIIALAKDEIGTNFTDAIIKRIRKDYVPRYWSANGPELINSLMEESCPELFNSPSYASKPIANCRGIPIFNFDLFYPMYFNDVDYIFDVAPNDLDVERPYTYHMWDYLTSNRTIYKNTLYDIVAKTFCPTIHDSYHEEFATNKSKSSIGHNK